MQNKLVWSIQVFHICCLHPRTHRCFFFFLGPPDNFGVSISVQSKKENSYGNLKSWGNKGTKGGNSIHRAQLLPTGWNQRGDTAAVRDATGSRDKRGRNAPTSPPSHLGHKVWTRLPQTNLLRGHMPREPGSGGYRGQR